MGWSDDVSCGCCEWGSPFPFFVSGPSFPCDFNVASPSRSVVVNGVWLRVLMMCCLMKVKIEISNEVGFLLFSCGICVVFWYICKPFVNRAIKSYEGPWGEQNAAACVNIKGTVKQALSSRVDVLVENIHLVFLTEGTQVPCWFTHTHTQCIHTPMHTHVFHSILNYFIRPPQRIIIENTFSFFETMKIE